MDDADEEGERDPFVGRLGREHVPGVFSGEVLGRCFYDPPRVQLFAYVYDGARPDRAVLELYLRLKTLATLVHELGHHQDGLTHVARGRWRADDRVDSEIRAEAYEYAWTRDFVIPYLEEAYPAEIAALDRWLVAHGGLALPLEILVGDPRTTRAEGGARLFFSEASAFEALLGEVARGGRPPDTQIQFANDLHYGEHYDEALAILDLVLAAHPEHPGALVLRADILVHLERPGEALTLARAVLARDPTDVEAWWVLRDVALGRGDWAGVLAAASPIRAALNPSPDWRWWASVEDEARAQIELGDEAARNLALLATRPVLGASLAAALGCLLALRRSDAQEAFDLALAALARPEGRHDAELRAVRLDAARRLGRPADVGELSEGAWATLRRRGYGAWVERLRASGAPRGDGERYS